MLSFSTISLFLRVIEAWVNIILVLARHAALLTAVTADGPKHREWWTLCATSSMRWTEYVPSAMSWTQYVTCEMGWTECVTNVR